MSQWSKSLIMSLQKWFCESYLLGLSLCRLEAAVWEFMLTFRFQLQPCNDLRVHSWFGFICTVQFLYMYIQNKLFFLLCICLKGECSVCSGNHCATLLHREHNKDNIGQLMALLVCNLFSLYCCFCWHRAGRKVVDNCEPPTCWLSTSESATMHRFSSAQKETGFVSRSHNLILSLLTFFTHHVKLCQTRILLAFAASTNCQAKMTAWTMAHYLRNVLILNKWLFVLALVVVWNDEWSIHKLVIS